MIRIIRRWLQGWLEAPVRIGVARAFSDETYFINHWNREEDSH